VLIYVGVGVNWICVLVEICPLFPVLSFANIACDVIVFVVLRFWGWLAGCFQPCLTWDLVSGCLITLSELLVWTWHLVLHGWIY